MFPYFDSASLPYPDFRPLLVSIRISVLLPAVFVSRTSPTVLVPLLLAMGRVGYCDCCYVPFRKIFFSAFPLVSRDRGRSLFQVPRSVAPSLPRPYESGALKTLSRAQSLEIPTPTSRKERMIVLLQEDNGSSKTRDTTTTTLHNDRPLDTRHTNTN
jgi:hypothetical protein